MKILVVDDEPLARERLMRLLGKLRPEAELLEAEDGRAAIALIEKHAPELLLLDIRMPGMDGLQVADVLDRMPCPPAVVFCTAYEQYALKALQHQTVAYLLKPVREPELAHALDTAGRVNRVQLEAIGTPPTGDSLPRQTISSHSHRGFETLHVADIRCFIAREKYVAAVTPEAELLIHDSLKELEEEFGERFLRVHRNALVAPAHIQRLEKETDDGWKVILSDVEYTPAISRRHLSEAKQRVSKAG